MKGLKQTRQALFAENRLLKAQCRRLTEQLVVFAGRLRCEAITANKGTQCRNRPWRVHRGRPVCGQHRHATTFVKETPR